MVASHMAQPFAVAMVLFGRSDGASGLKPHATPQLGAGPQAAGVADIARSAVTHTHTHTRVELWQPISRGCNDHVRAHTHRCGTASTPWRAAGSAATWVVAQGLTQTAHEAASISTEHSTAAWWPPHDHSCDCGAHGCTVAAATGIDAVYINRVRPRSNHHHTQPAKRHVPGMAPSMRAHTHA